MNEFKKNPMFIKSEEILQTLNTITDLIPEGSEELLAIKEKIFENIYTIQAKIISIDSSLLWDVKMEGAVIIRMCAKELHIIYHDLMMYDFPEVEYYQIVRNHIEHFRIMFRIWVTSFNPTHYMVDEWGLLNPPGIPQDYEQSYDELEFLHEEDEDEDQKEDED